jgi:drug/metabolite transporter (DMT)-like permease
MVVAATVIPLAFAGPLGRLALMLGATPMMISFWRLLLATLGTLAYALTRKKARRSFRTITRSNIMKAILTGLLLAGHYLCWYSALERTTIFNVTVLGALQPFFTLAGGWLLYRDPLKKKAVWGVALVTAGAMLMGFISWSGSGRSSLSGDSLALLTAVFFSAYLLMGQSIRKYIPASTYMVLLYGSCTVFLSLFSIITRQSVLPADIRVIGICVLLTFTATFLVHSVYNWSVNHVGALYITMITLAEPIGATLVGWILFQEKPVALSFFGGFLILGGILWFLKYQARLPKTYPADKK